jgi:hypothetical protein
LTRNNNTIQNDRCDTLQSYMRNKTCLFMAPPPASIESLQASEGIKRRELEEGNRM